MNLSMNEYQDRTHDTAITYHDAIKEFSPLYADDLKIDDKRAYLAERRAEIEKYLERIIKMEEAEVKESAFNQKKGE